MRIAKGRAVAVLEEREGLQLLEVQCCEPPPEAGRPSAGGGASVVAVPPAAGAAAVLADAAVPAPGAEIAGQARNDTSGCAGGPEAGGGSQTCKAYNYLSLGPAVAVGEHVLLNTTAVDLGLGTGGAHFVVPSASPGDVSSGGTNPQPPTSRKLPGRAASLNAPLDLDEHSIPDNTTSPHDPEGRESPGRALSPKAPLDQEELSVPTSATSRKPPGTATASGGGLGDAALPVDLQAAAGGGLGEAAQPGDLQAAGGGGLGEAGADSMPAAGGHIMKLRYTPLQKNVLCVEEPSSPYHGVMAEADSLEGIPVVCCALHSQMPLVAAALKSAAPSARIACCVSDEGALPLAYSHILNAARANGLIDASISCGQAFGGDFEAVTLYSGLLAARHVAKADAAIVCTGPGNVGTASRFGHTGIAQGLALNAAAALDGVPVCALRISFADKRARHHGISHHSLTALARICMTEAVVALPSTLPSAQMQAITSALEAAGVFDRHGVVELEVRREAIDLRGMEVHTMGRNEASDPAFFTASFAAGLLAAQLHAQRRNIAGDKQ